MTLAQADFGKKYTIIDVDTGDEELNDFLFTLGCYSGEDIVVVSMISSSLVVSIRDGRYNIDRDLAQVIQVG